MDERVIHGQLLRPSTTAWALWKLDERRLLGDGHPALVSHETARRYERSPSLGCKAVRVQITLLDDPDA